MSGPYSRLSMTAVPTLTGTLSAASRVVTPTTPTPGESSVTDHNDLTGRDAADAHPISAITGLEETLDDMQEDFVDSGDFATEEDILEILSM